MPMYKATKMLVPVCSVIVRRIIIKPFADSWGAFSCHGAGFEMFAATSQCHSFRAWEIPITGVIRGTSRAYLGDFINTRGKRVMSSLFEQSRREKPAEAIGGI